jgi:hypothetical protein
MQIPKEQIVSFLESRGQGDQAQQADAQLPDQVDHEDHADLLQEVGVNPQELLSKFGNEL